MIEAAAASWQLVRTLQVVTSVPADLAQLATVSTAKVGPAFILFLLFLLYAFYLLLQQLGSSVWFDEGVTVRGAQVGAADCFIIVIVVIVIVASSSSSSWHDMTNVVQAPSHTVSVTCVVTQLSQ